MRTNNLEVIKAFRQGKEATSHNGNLISTGAILINYSTPIAKHSDNGIILNSTKYSRTTSTIQSKVRQYCNVIEEVEVV